MSLNHKPILNVKCEELIYVCTISITYIYIYIYITFRLLNLYKVYNLLHVAEKHGVGNGERKKDTWVP
jgi:hypothetical protein